MPSILGNHHVLAVRDVNMSAQFFVDVLGFESVFDGGGWRFVRRDNCMIMLGECPDAMAASETGDHAYFAYLLVDDVDAFWAEIDAEDVEVVSPLADKAWNMREFGVRTPDGHRLMIGQDIDDASEAG